MPTDYSIVIHIQIASDGLAVAIIGFSSHSTHSPVSNICLSLMSPLERGCALLVLVNVVIIGIYQRKTTPVAFLN